MKKRGQYLLWFLGLLAIECLIGAFVRDRFIRPYVGDLLVTVLLCCLVRVFFPEGSRLLPVWVFGFAAAVECSQLLNLPKLLGLEGTALALALGATFDWKDLLCYAAGCGLFALAESIWKQKEGSV